MKNRLLILLSAALLASCGQTPLTPYSGFNPLVFHSYFGWSYDTAGKDISEEINEFVDLLDRLTDPYTSSSSLRTVYTLNHTNSPVVVDPLLIEILQTALDMKEKTEGYFNPFIGKVTSLWKETLFGLDGSKDPETITDEEIQAAEASAPALIEEMNATSLIIDEAARTVQRVGEGHIDLGGLVKGFAVEKVQQMVLEKGAVHYLINGGQSSLSLGKTSKDGPWKVNLKYSFLENENSYYLQDTDTSTSAIYEQSVKYNGKWYSHVMNPVTGIPVTDYSMAFLEGSNSALLDAFSTSCMIAGPEKTKEWADKYDFRYALFFDAYGGAGFAKLKEESPELTAVRANDKSE